MVTRKELLQCTMLSLTFGQTISTKERWTQMSSSQWRIRNLKEFQIISTDIPLIIINPLHYNDILSRSAVLSSDSLYYQMLLSCLTQSQYIFLSCCFLSMPVPIWKYIINLHFSRFFAMLFLNACFIQVFQYSLGLNDPNSCSSYKPANIWFFNWGTWRLKTQNTTPVYLY